jgi:CHASE2 domain-containing sensor protein/energy-coupling factor transporter ATP-binding protein EcfA2
MNTFEITIQRKLGDYYPVVSEYSRAGVFLPIRSEGKLRLTPADVEELTSLLSQPKDYGICLGELLFTGNLDRAFATARNWSEERLRVLLFVEAEDLELKRLRWERLCAPMDGGWNFLRRDQRVPYSLYIPSITDRRFPPIGQQDLRALVLVASPKDSKDYKLCHFDVEEAVASVRSALGDRCDVLAHGVEGAIGLPTLDHLCDQLTRQSYTLLHFVCHGQLTADKKETVLYWTNQDNQAESLHGTHLINELKNIQGPKGLPHFAFLCTCESASKHESASEGESKPEGESEGESKPLEGAFAGLAEQLVRDLGMPAVVAMTERITIDTAEVLVKRFYQQLREHGEVDLALDEATAGLGSRHDIIVPALFSRLGGRPLFSDTLDRPLTTQEIRYGLERLQQLLTERAPVLQGEFEQQQATLASTLGVEVSELRSPALEERQSALAGLNKLSGEVLDLSFNALALDKKVPEYDDRCPFRGLYPFRVADQEFFFGREVLIQTFQSKLKEHHFLAVLGASGSGKSSLVLAGLIPALQKDEPALHLAYMTPSSNPLAQIETSLAKVQGQTFVLVVDQFEELFTLCIDQAQRQAFIQQLLTLVGQQQRIILTMRADFWGECATYSELKALVQNRQELIGAMDATELRQAMEQQAAKVGLRFEAGLSNAILDAVQGEPGAMPLLQHALQELWKQRHGRWLRYDEYEKLGGVKKAIATTADEFYKPLSPDEKRQIRHIFEQLTRVDEDFDPPDQDNPSQESHKPKDTRRRVELKQLTTANSNIDPTRNLVAKLADARLVITKRDEVTERDEVEVAHEALILHWEQLQRWLSESRDRLKFQQQLRPAIQRWRANQDDGELLRGARLQQAVTYLDATPDAFSQEEKGFIQASQALPHRKPRFFTVLKTGVAVAVAVAAVRILGIMQPMELAAYDQWMRLKPGEAQDDRILIVAVNDSDIRAQAERQEEGTSSVLKDASLQKLLTKLQANQPRVIGLDLLRDFPARTQALKTLLSSNRNLIGICTAREGTSSNTAHHYPLEIPVDQVPVRVGFSNFIDSDVTRRQPLLNPVIEPERCPTENSFSFAIARHYLQTAAKNKPYQPPATQQGHYAGNLRFGEIMIKRRTGLAAGYQGDLSEPATYELLLNYRTYQGDATKFAEKISLEDFLKLDSNASKQKVRDKIVIIGADSEVSGDYVPTPYSRTQIAGPIVQAQMVSQIVSAVLDGRPLIWWLPVWLDVLWIGFWAIVGGLIVWKFQPLLQWVVGGVAIVSLTGICYAVFAYQSGWIPLVPPMLALIITAGVVAFITLKLREGNLSKLSGAKKPNLIAANSLNHLFHKQTSQP